MLCFRNIPVAKSYWTRGGGGGEYQDIPSITFCLTVPKKIVGEHFCVSLIPGIEEVYV